MVGAPGWLSLLAPSSVRLDTSPLPVREGRLRPGGWDKLES